MNYNRVDLEREFSKSSRDNTRFGEISDQNQDEDEEDIRGMPLRSQYSIRKQQYNSNDYIDFHPNDNLKSDLNVEFNDSSQIGANIQSSMTKITSQVSPISTYSSNITNLNDTLFNYMYQMLDKSFIINGFGLCNLFGSLYLLSSGTSEIELKTFFEFSKKDMVYAGLKKLNVNSNILRMKNFMIIGNDVSYNPNYFNNIKDFCMLLRPDITKVEEESQKINFIIKKLMNDDMRNPITSDNLYNTQLMLLNTTVFHPIWQNPFDKIIKENNRDFLYSANKSFEYFEDSNTQLLEVKCIDKLVFGIIIKKDNSDPEIDENKLKFFISQMKESVLDEVKIPVIRQDLKIRYNTTLKNLGLRSIFIKFVSPEAFPEGIQLQDTIQNVKIIIDNASVKSDSKYYSRGYRTIRKFLCNKSFIYYLRLNEAILLIGHY